MSPWSTTSASNHHRAIISSLVILRHRFAYHGRWLPKTKLASSTDPSRVLSRYSRRPQICLPDLPRPDVQATVTQHMFRSDNRVIPTTQLLSIHTLPMIETIHIVRTASHRSSRRGETQFHRIRQKIVMVLESLAGFS